MTDIAVFVSGGGSNMQALLDTIEDGKIKGRVRLVLSSTDKAYALQRAHAAGIKTLVLPKELKERERVTLEALRENGISLCVLAGYLGIISPEVVREYENRIINIHPSLIPSFCGKGYYGHFVHEAVLEYGAKVSGCTTHFVAQGIDTGPIIMQRAVYVKQEDTPQTLADRILEQEHIILPESVRLFCEGAIEVNGRKVIIKERKE